MTRIRRAIILPAFWATALFVILGPTAGWAKPDKVDGVGVPFGRMPQPIENNRYPRTYYPNTEKLGIQHFVSYSGDNVNQTALRLIALQKLPRKAWLKYDLKAPIDWENDNDIPATAEAQLGMMLTKSFGAYVDALAGVGGDRPYDWGLGVGVRLLY